MTTGENFPTNNEIDPATENNNPWQKMAEDAPLFNPERKQEQAVDDSGLVQAMVNQNNDNQEVLEYYLEQLKLQGGYLDNDQLKELEVHGVHWSPYAIGGSITEAIENRITHGQELEHIVVDALSQQSAGSRELQGKPIEEILEARINKAIEQMKRYDLDNMTDIEEKSYDKLGAEKRKIDDALGWVRGFRKYSYNPEVEQKANTIDAVSAMDQMDAERDKLEKNLEVVEKKKRNWIEWEKAHYGYVEGEGRPPMTVLAAEEDIDRIRIKIIQKEKDSDLLYKVYKENGKNQSLSSIEAQSIIDEMIQDRDAKMAAIDEKIDKVEKKSEEWRKLKQERAEIYRTVPDDVVERIMKLFN